MIDVSASHCALHPDRAASTTCSRCGAFACTTCSRRIGERTICVRCHEPWFRGQPSPESRFVYGLAVFSTVIACFPLALFAAYLASRELKRIGNGDAPLSGRHYARTARILGVGSSIPWAIIVIALASYLLLIWR